jgi:uncharacterized membrane protein
VVDIVCTANAAPMCIIVRPNSVLHRGEGVLALAVTALVGVLIAVGFTLLGAWPVAPFVVLALAGLGLAVYLVGRHVGDFERIVVNDDWLTVDRHDPLGDQHFEFNGYWVQVEQKNNLDGGCEYLALRSHGRELVVGSNLTTEERAEVSRALRVRLARLRQ